MQRREFARTLLLGTGAACSLSFPAAYAAINAGPRAALRTVLARAEVATSGQRWRPIELCSSGACPAPLRVRVAIDSLGIPGSFRALVVDAMFATRDGLKPFRVATFQPGAVSPASKPFAFEVDAAGLAGFRIEHANADPGNASVAASALLGALRPTLDAGRYLLAMSDTGVPDLGALPVPPEANQPVVLSTGDNLPFAWLAFSVQPSGA